MLNRRILRIKVFKVLYSYAENQGMTLKEAQTQFKSGCEATRDLYLFMLAVIPALTQEASDRIEAARSKFHPTEEEKNPNMKFVGNSLASILSSDPDFTKLLEKKKLSWGQYDVFLRRLYNSVRSKDYFTSYMDSPERSLKEDARLFSRIFEEEFEDNSDLWSIIEDISIFWVDDLPYALIQCCKTLSELGKGAVWELPELYTAENGAFAGTLLETGFNSFPQFRQWIAESAAKWDDERLFNVDVTLIVTGLSEAKSFPKTPKGIMINEYVEISKYYSTPKSRSFVNGMLDELMKNRLSL